MKQFPAVSFVMPAFNAEKFIDESIGSIMRQTVDNWELVIVNDGSTDRTAEIAQHYADTDPRITLHSLPAPTGSAYQPRRHAILNTANRLVAPLDADDWIEPDYLEKLLLKMEETGADIVYPTMHYGDESERTITPLDKELYAGSHKGKECVKLTLDGWRINCNGGVIRKECYTDTFSTFGSSLTYSCADELLSRQLLFMTPTVAFSPAKYFYRPNCDSITRKKSAKLFDFILNNRTLLQFTRDNFGENSEEYILAQQQNFHGIFNALRLLNKYKFSTRDKDYALTLIEKSRKLVDEPLLSPHVSPRYMALLRRGVPQTKMALMIADSFRNLINKRI